MNNYEIMEIQRQMRKQEVSHLLHLFLSVITVGIWLLMWFLVTVSSTIETARLKGELKKLCEAVDIDNGKGRQV